MIRAYCIGIFDTEAASDPVAVNWNPAKIEFGCGVLHVYRAEETDPGVWSFGLLHSSTFFDPVALTLELANPMFHAISAYNGAAYDLPLLFEAAKRADQRSGAIQIAGFYPRAVVHPKDYQTLQGALLSKLIDPMIDFAEATGHPHPVSLATLAKGMQLPPTACSGAQVPELFKAGRHYEAVAKAKADVSHLRELLHVGLAGGSLGVDQWHSSVNVKAPGFKPEKVPDEDLWIIDTRPMRERILRMLEMGRNRTVYL